jgi:hypothetical protein
MIELHIGRGTDRDSVSLFPVWGTYAGQRGYVTDTTAVSLSERPDGAAVESLQATNAGTSPVLMLEGQLLEGGLQNRMLVRSMLLPSRNSVPLDVVCVEQGRWGGKSGHRSSGRRASMRVRTLDEPRADRQATVWQRVAECDARYGANATSSFAVHAERAADEVDRLVAGLRPLPGQIGVVIGIAGQPVMLEAFDSPATLHKEFDAIIRAAAFDAVDGPPQRTPARRVIRFVDRAAKVEMSPVAPAGAGVTVTGSSPYAGVNGLRWRKRLLHLTFANPRHQLNAMGV